MVRPSNLYIGDDGVSHSINYYKSANSPRDNCASMPRGFTGFFLLNVIHGGNSTLSVILVGVPNESKSAASTSIAVLNHNLVVENSIEWLAN